MARVLYLSHALPYPLDAGPKVRQYYMLRHLAERHEVTLVSFARWDDCAEAGLHLEALCRSVRTAPVPRSAAVNARAAAKGLFTGLPMTVVRDESAEMRALVSEVVSGRRFDVIHSDQLSMAWYGQYAARVARERGGRPVTVLDQHNAIALLTERMTREEQNPARRAVIQREAAAFKRYEAQMCRDFDAVLTVSDEDAAALLTLQSGGHRRRLAAKLTTVPICVDPERTEVIPPAQDGRSTVLHLGTMFWPPNIHGVLWFAREVLPRVRREVPEARFVVAGKNPPREVRALSADPQIEVTGYVKDPVEYLAATDAFVVPVAVGGGMRVKILQAWLWGLPVVSSVTGAEGIAGTDGRDLLLARDGDAEGFGAAVARALTDRRLNMRLRSEGRATVEAHYNWRQVYGRVNEVYDRLSSGEISTAETSDRDEDRRYANSRWSN